MLIVTAAEYGLGFQMEETASRYRDLVRISSRGQPTRDGAVT